MTATDELRRLLDERGVEWRPMHDTEAGYHEDRDTEFLVDGCKHVAHEWWGHGLQVDMLIPAQVIAATLGHQQGTCRIVKRRETDLWWEERLTMECGYDFKWSEPEYPHFCPYCRRRVVE